jgi:hypothetical protein
MIYPATYDITVLQNATWESTFRATDPPKELTSITVNAGTPTFTCSCHGFVAGDKVVFTGGTAPPCGLTINTVYYVIATGLTHSTFQVSATNGGASITVTSEGTGTFYVAEPLNLTGYTVDADIRGLLDNVQIATFVCTLTDAANGQFTVSLAPATTEALSTGRYGYDVSLTSPGGFRYYWLTGVATVQRTFSRN